jgi:hypothetical protein
MAGVARENVSRALSEWKRRGLVTRSSGFYSLSDNTTLKRYAVDEGRGLATMHLPASPPVSHFAHHPPN